MPSGGWSLRASGWLSFQDNGHMPSLTLIAPDWQNIPSTALSTSGPEGESLDLLISSCGRQSTKLFEGRCVFLGLEAGF